MKLQEWVDKNGNKVTIPKTTPVSNKTSSGGFKNRLERLFEYNNKHKNPVVKKINLIQLTEASLAFTEYWGEDTSIFYKIFIGPTTEAWHVEVYTATGKADIKKSDDLVGTGWVELLKSLRPFISVPVTSTPEYKELLTEWVDKNGKKVNLKATSSDLVPDQTYRFERLVAQIQADKRCRIQVNNLTETVLEITTGNYVKIKIERLPQFPNYVLKIGNYRRSYDDYDDLLDALIEEGIIANTDLCESASIVEDFRAYENLWD